MCAIALNVVATDYEFRSISYPRQPRCVRQLVACLFRQPNHDAKVDLTDITTPHSHRGVVRAPRLVVEVSRVARRAIVPRSYPHLIEST